MSTVWAMPPLRQGGMTVRTVERVEVPAADNVDVRIQFRGQSSWIRATRAQAEQALLIGGVGVRADRVVCVEREAPLNELSP